MDRTNICTEGNIQFLLYSFYKSGCTKKVNFECTRCEDPNISAFFRIDQGQPKVVICENNSLRAIKHTITHELVHAFDYCRVCTVVK